MAKLIFKPRTYVLLSIIADVSTPEEGTRYAIFDNSDTRLGTWCKALSVFVQIGGADAHILRALARHGFTKAVVCGRLQFAYRITEAGQKVHAEWLKTVPKDRAAREAYPYRKI